MFARDTSRPGGGVVFWNVDIPSWEQLAGRIAKRNFTLDEWHQFFPDLPYRDTFKGLRGAPVEESVRQANISSVPAMTPRRME